MRIIVTLAFLIITFCAVAQDNANYQLPPKDIMDLVLAEPTPTVYVDGKGEWMIQGSRSPLSTVAELGSAEARIAGLRMDPDNFSSSRTPSFNALVIKNIKTKAEVKLTGLPAELRAWSIQWSEDETKFAFTQTNADGVDLYVVNIADGKATKINTRKLNTIMTLSL